MKPLVYLHGFTGCPQNFDAVRQHLPAACRVFAPPLAGHDAGPASAGSFEHEAQRLSQAIASEFSEPALLLGYSLGGRIALSLLCAAPEQFAAVVLVGVHPGLHTDAERQARAHSDEEHARFLEQYGTAQFIEQRWSKLTVLTSQARLPPALLAAQHQQRLRHAPRGLASSLRQHGLAQMPDRRAELAHFAASKPVTLLTGALDEKFSLLARELQQTQPRIAWHELPDVGHNALLEAPERVARLLIPALH